MTFKTECVPFTGAISANGYGHQWDGTKVRRAHRLAWERECGAIPAGVVVRHMCHNRACVNVEHLALGTQADNIEDTRKAGNIPRGDDHWNAKLADFEVESIRNDTEHTQKWLAERYGCHQSTVSKIKKGTRRVNV